MKFPIKRSLALALITSVVAASSPLAAAQAQPQAQPLAQAEIQSPDPFKPFQLIARYETGFQNPDGGVAEIVAYSPVNKSLYVVNGQENSLDILSLDSLTSKTAPFSTSGQAAPAPIALTKRLDVSKLIPNFNFGDMTSVAVSPDGKALAIAMVEADYTKPGALLLLNLDGSVQETFPAGVQPDMVTFSPDGRYLLSANEGEPRMGYAADNTTVDPKGTITIVDLSVKSPENNITEIGFEAFDDQIALDALVAQGVLLKKGALPSRDLEPEYMAIDASSQTAYVSLQEANAIAAIDLSKKTVKSIKALGFKDHNLPENPLDAINDGKIAIVNQNLLSAPMPDGINYVNIAGKGYILTANEGDGREWGKYENLTKIKIGDKKVDVLNPEETLGLQGPNTMIGGRSFSILDADTLTQVYDSRDLFERITAETLPAYFNTSNKNTKLDDRSGKKGPEPEDVKTLTIADHIYAFIGLERIGGIAIFDITNPAAPQYKMYLNSRDYSAPIAGDVAPEGLITIPAQKSPTGTPLLVAAHEVSGTVAIYSAPFGGSDTPGGPETPPTTATLNLSLSSDQPRWIYEQGDGVTVVIKVTQAQNLDAMDLRLTFDPKVLTYLKTDFEVNSGFTVSGVNGNKPNEIRIIAGTTDPITQDTLLKLRFRAKSPVHQTSTVELKEVHYTESVNHKQSQLQIGKPDHTTTLALTNFVAIFDQNADKKVDLGDLSQALKAYRAKAGDPNWVTAQSADFNGDGVVDISDYTWLASYLANQPRGDQK